MIIKHRLKNKLIQFKHDYKPTLQVVIVVFVSILYNLNNSNTIS
jgi:hypothetical protein